MAAATAAKVPIPAAVRRTIQNIKEIAGGHTDEEVYAALRECNMDPNETAQKLLLQDTFHEVKRKRDKKKESNKEPAGPRWNQVAQGLGGKGGRGNYSSRQFCNSSDLTGRTVFAGKENELNLSMDKCSRSSPVNPNTETRTSIPISSLSGRLSNGPSQPVAPMEKHSLAIRDFPSSDSKRLANQEGTQEEVVVDLGPDVSQSLVEPPPSIPGVCSSVSTPEVASHENNNHGEIVVAKHAFRGQQTTGDYVMAPSSVLKDTCWPSDSSSIALPSGSRPSSSYSSCSQQLSGSQKVVPNKEWKPKSTYKPTQAANITCNPVTVEVVRQLYPVSTSIHKEDISSKVDKMLGDMQFLDKQHVIIPDHLQVTESEKYGLSFGSFGTSYKQTVGFSNDHESEKSFTLPEYESSREVDEIGDGYVSSHQGASSAVEAAAEPGPQQPTAEVTDNISPQEVDTSSSTPEAAESDQSKDTAPSHIPQDSVQNTPSYSTFSVTPQPQENQMPLLEVSEYQVQLTNNFSANYYTQLYRPIADVDGYLSPFTAPGAAIKSGNMSILPGQTVQTQEGLNSLVLSSSGSTPLPIPAPGTVPSSVAIPQQPLPVFRQPVGVHLPHYQPSFIPYNQYISPFYVPQHALHHFMGNAAFPHAPSAVYPPVSSAGAPPVKYSATTYKPGANTGSQTHAVTPGAYGTYASSPPVFTNNNVVVSGTSAENGDVSGSQFKENNIYIAGQQSEGSTVWIPTPGREFSALQSSSFYGLPPQGQHLAFAPAQVGHGAYGGMYHPAQTLPGGAVHPLLQPSQTIAGAVEMVGPPASGYQQPQHAQMNWGSY